MAAQIASIAFLALILPVAALVFPKSTWAASGNVQVCQPNASCTVGEFLYNDSYTPITTATCTITSRYPNGTLLLSAVSMPASSEGDGWYAHTFTAPTTLGLYRTEVKCVVGSDTMALDKSFEVQTAPSTLTSSDVASAVWGYSGRSLTTFGSLVSDIWSNAARTVTGFDSGSFATSTDVSSVKTTVSDVKSIADKIKELVEQIKPSTTVTNINNISQISQEIKNINEENRILLEQIINRPIIESAFEFDFSFDFQSKVDETQENNNKLLTQTRYLKSKTGVIDHKWKNLSEDEVTDRLLKLAGVTEMIVKDLTQLRLTWNWQAIDNTSKQAREVKSKILSLEKGMKKDGKSTSNQQALKRLYKEVVKLETSIEKNLLAQVDKVDKQAYILDSKSADADQILAGWNPLDLKGISKKVASLAKDVSEVNLIPKTNHLLAVNLNKNYTEKELKNKVLGIKGVLSANKKFLAATPGQPLNQLWLEEGSIVFKSLITNPSSKISQEVPVKYYLPAEVKRENIVSVDDGLTVNFDAEKDRYYVSGKFKLAAGESKTISVTVDDSVFHIAEEEIASIRKQVEELSKPLENTAYFAQGALLKSDINASLDKVENLQKDGLTPEAKIRAYREAYIEYKAAKEKLEKLKEIATSAGSVGTLFGFVGGAQAIAVWGLIIIMVAGFVFLTLYLRSIRKEEMVIAQTLAKPTKKVKLLSAEEPIHADERRSFPHYKAMAVLIIGIIGISAVGGVALTARKNVQNEAEKPQQVATIADEKSVLGAESEKVEDLKGEEVNLFVPEETQVSIHREPKLDSEVLITLEASQKVLRVSSQDGWVKVVVESGESGKKIAGWVDEDFIENSKESVQIGEPKKTSSRTFQLITIIDTPTGFLRVRSGPWGEELGKVDPGSKFPVLDSKSSWSQIVLDDGSLGWVSDKYISFEKSPVGGLD